MTDTLFYIYCRYWHYARHAITTGIKIDVTFLHKIMRVAYFGLVFTHEERNGRVQKRRYAAVRIDNLYRQSARIAA